MKKINYISIVTLLLSCGSNELKTAKQQNSDVVQQTNETIVEKDTIIVYDIDNISSEGTEAVVKYHNGKIQESTISIYGETGQAKIIYLFSTDSIYVMEKEYAYNEDLKKVSSEKDMKIKKEINYIIDWNGQLIGNSGKDRLDVFQEFKKVVPFKLSFR